MAVTTNDDGTQTFTGPDIDVYKVLMVRQGLILKIDTGMELTRTISSLAVAKRDGLTTKRTCRGALVDVNKWLEARGARPVWSKKYPQG